MKYIKRMICLLTAAIMILTSVPVNAATQQTTLESGGMELQGKDSFGAMLAEDFNEYQEVQNEEGYTAGYNVTDLRMEGNTAIVEYAAAEEAVLMVAIYTQDYMELLFSESVNVSAEDHIAYVNFEDSLPAYFQVSAFLLKPVELYALCAEFKTSRYTSWMQELLNSTVEDYDPELVWNFDENKDTNFAVFSENVIRLEAGEKNKITFADDEQHIYVIENADYTVKYLEQGDILSGEYDNGRLMIVKVGELTVEGNTVTIVGAPVEIEEVFSHMKIQADADAGDTIVDTSEETDFIYEGMSDYGSSTFAARKEVGDNQDKPFEKTLNFSVGNFSDDEKDDVETDDDDNKDDDNKDDDNKDDDNKDDVEIDDDKIDTDLDITGTLDITFRIVYEYYISTGYNYMFFQADMIDSIGLDIKVSVETTLMKIPKMTVHLVAGVVSLGFEPQFKVSFSVKGAINATVYDTIGFLYQTGGGVQNLSGASEPELDFDMEGEVFAGIDWNPTLEIVEGSVADINFPALTGLRITAKLTGTHFDDPDPNPYPRSKHTCNACIEAKVNGVIELGVELVFLNFLKVEMTVLKLEPFPFDFYYSFTNEVLGSGKCPYVEHRVTVRVLDYKEQPLANATVSLLEEGERQYKGVTGYDGVVFVYLPVGEHRLTAIVSGEELGMDVQVQEACVVVISKLITQLQDPDFLKEFMDAENITGYGKVIDGGTCGAQAYNMTWQLFDSGALVISGTGEMADFTSYQEVPWDKYLMSQITSVVLRGNVTHIGTLAFHGTRIETMEIPYTVQSIGVEAFRQSWIKELDIPFSVTEIAEYAFYGSDLETLTIPDSITELKRRSFSNCPNLVQVELPNTIETIGEGCFADSQKLLKFYMPDSVTTLGNGVFKSNNVLKEVHLSDKLTVIPVATFSGCVLLENVNIPSGVTSIEESAFRGCESLTEIVLPQGLESISSFAFSTSGLTEVEFPASLTFLGSYAFNLSDNLIRIVFRGDCPNKLENPYAGEGDDPYYYLIATPLSWVNENAVVYYPANGSGWNDMNMSCFGYDLTWQSYIGEPPARMLNLEQSGESNALLSEVMESEVFSQSTPDRSYRSSTTSQLESLTWSENAQLYTAEFHELQPGRAYTVLVVDAGEVILENLLYVTCIKADSSGDISVSFASSQTPERTLISTAPWKDLSDAQVTFGTLTADDQLQSVVPKVVWAGEELTLGVDYMLTGDTLYREAGIYSCSIHGIGRYIGTLDCSYEVLAADEEDKDNDENKEPDNPDKPITNPFEDVHQNEFYYDAVLWALKEKVTTGVSPTMFAPNQTCTRAEVVTFLWRAMGSPDPVLKVNPFKDVAADEYYYKAVIWAVEEGITKGISPTEFSPSAFCSRGEVVTFLHRTMKEPEVKDSNSFSDVEQGEFYFNAVLWAVKEGITLGTGDGKFSPSDSCTRGQIVTFLYRTFSK